MPTYLVEILPPTREIRLPRRMADLPPSATKAAPAIPSPAKSPRSASSF